MSGLALVYHRVAERAGDHERELLPALDLAAFRRAIDWLRRRYEVVPASELYGRAGGERAGGRVPLALTFDDDLLSHAEVVAEELRSRGLTATFFLGGTGLGGDATPPWWELLEAAAARSPEEALRGRSLRDAAAGVELLPPSEQRRETDRLRSLAGEVQPANLLDSEQIRALARSGMEIGFHTRPHHRLTGLRGAELDAALRDGRDALEALAGAPIRCIAYPHGAADDAVIAAARRAGYEYGFTTDGAALGAGVDPLAIPRIYPRRSRLRLAMQLRNALRAAR